VYSWNLPIYRGVPIIEQRPMMLLDYLELMKANKGVQPEYDNLPDDKKRLCGQINISTGTAVSYFEDGKLIGVFGIRQLCLGEVWGLSMPELREDRKKTLFGLAKDAFNKTVNDLHLLRVFANPVLSEVFLEHLGFSESEKISVWHYKE
jgi:hypothetical protein